MKNPQSRSAPRGGFSVSDNSSSSNRSFTEIRTSAQAGSSSPAADPIGDDIEIATFERTARGLDEANTNASGRMVLTTKGLTVGLKGLQQFAQAVDYDYCVQIGLTPVSS